ncbi:MAG: 50S ribosomal protein L29 [bacterium]|uniref:Large ribosomal subunit protein uL29 n=1 Tax=candidate division WOR-3 bacterium TaxID=2052148 RepID=A0A348MIM5_UNCW3|nr:50S ribosomal protein L29 [bacterium]HAF06901.1 50S ribosomal protein L29 [candidate division WOR-3 bacterium]HCP15958.1 50S ribosomal protein L29 [candidate division WOR-3 bacterium]
MKIKDIREMNVKELDSKLHELQEQLFLLRIKSKTTEITNNAQFKNLRKDIARILTVKRERENQ